MTEAISLPPAVAIALEPTDWFLAPWRRLAPLPCPPAAPFDLARGLARLTKLTSATEDSWDHAALSPAMSALEARFWYEAITQSGPAAPPRALALRLGRSVESHPLTRREVLSRLRRHHEHISPHIILPLAQLLPLHDLIDVALSSDLDDSRPYPGKILPLHAVLRRGIQRFLIPYLTQEQLAPLHEQLRERLQEALAGYRGGPPPEALLLAAAFGLHGQIEPVVSSWKAQPQTGPVETRAQWVVFGLGSAELVRQHMRRLGLRLMSTRQVIAWLACTELTDLEFIRDSVLACTHKPGAERLLEGFLRVEAAEAAPLMLELELTSKAPQLAARWLEKDPGRTAAGLVALAGNRGKVGEAARKTLRDLSLSGHADVVETVLDQAGAARRVRRAVTGTPAASVPFDADSTPPWLAQAAVEQLGGRPRALPRWLALEHLPALRLGEHHLNGMQAHAAVNALRESTLQKQMPLVTLLKERAEPTSRDAFAWEVFSRWLEAGAPSADRWAMLAVGLWGGDASVVKLAPLVRNWPGESHGRRALVGLECLRAIGTESALLELSAIAQKIRFRKLQQVASGFMYEIASERGLSTAQLEDRVVPYLDLDAQGARVFDFGSRQFRLALDHKLEPMLCDEAGKVRADLPKPGVKDPPRATEAVAAWKVFKKQLREVLKVQRTRLESAMLAQRRWQPDEFETYVVRHPLMGLLAQGILWGAVDAEGRLLQTFRITADRTCADRHEAPCSPAGAAGVIIVHPLHLDEGERKAWQEVFVDHEILAPFPQLMRRVFTLLRGEAKQTVLHRFDGKKVPALTLLGFLDRTGWERGRGDEAAGYSSTTTHLRYFPQVDVMAVLRYRDGVPLVTNYQATLPDQTLAGCFFVSGAEEPATGFDSSQALALGRVDGIVLSEVLAALDTLASKSS
jgi:hypothetical protein